MKRGLKAALGVSIIPALVERCATMPTGKQAFMIYTEDMEREVGKQYFSEFLSHVHRSNDTRMVEIVKRVGKRVAAVSPRPNYEWQFELIASQKVNAFAAAGGKVALYEGMLKICRNEAGIACVLGHEVGHAVARHAGQRMSQNTMVSAAKIGVDIGLANNKNKDLIKAGVEIGTEVGILLPFSREHEYEADNLGFQYMAKAGYDPEEAIGLWERYISASGSESAIWEFFSTHPMSLNRLKQMRSFLPWARKMYQASAEKFGSGETL